MLPASRFAVFEPPIAAVTITRRGCDTGFGVTNLIHARALPAAVVAVVFAIVARIMGSVTDGGALTGLLVAFILMLAGGFAGFIPLLTLFLLTVISTRWGYGRKLRLGVAERKRGRTASQVLANLGAAAACALPAVWFPEVGDLCLVASAAALAEAAADTVSSEMGQATARAAYMVTDFSDAPIGTNGAVSVEGTISGCVAACIISWVSAVVGLVDWHWTPVIALVAVAGMFLDSLMGAIWENSGKLPNDAVNFISTVFAADAAFVVTMVMQRVGN